jgi:threonine/homoserine/homoserine lactone efflux protein
MRPAHGLLILVGSTRGARCAWLAPRSARMSFQAWLAFTAATLVLLVIPGPTILLVVSYALGRGMRAALPMAAGVALGDFTAMTLSLLGLGAVLAASATLFTALRWAGAAYIIWMGWKLWRAGGSLRVEAREDDASPWRMLAHAWVVTALNPKSIVFFVAFVPQFMDPKAGWLTQMLVMEATFLTLAFLNAFTYAALASRARAVARDARAIMWFNRAGGAALMGAGAYAAASAARA